VAFDIRISAGDLRKMEELNRQIQGGVGKLDARAIEKVTVDVAGKLNDGVRKILANLDTVQSRLGVDPTSAAAKNLRVGLETAEGATSAVKQAAPFLALLSGSPQVRMALLAASGIAGAIEGLSREHMRRITVEAEKAAQQVRRSEERFMRHLQDQIDRADAALRAGKRLR
jgi:ABC-type phosphate/phosphonate transport system substrate-binding protein